MSAGGAWYTKGAAWSKILGNFGSLRLWMAKCYKMLAFCWFFSKKDFWRWFSMMKKGVPKKMKREDATEKVFQRTWVAFGFYDVTWLTESPSAIRLGRLVVACGWYCCPLRGPEGLRLVERRIGIVAKFGEIHQHMSHDVKPVPYDS